ncbi:MAG: carboxypeptidase regulatory-like domain-containing protein [Candidatus Bathyarchaeia archaeon]
MVNVKLWIFAEPTYYTRIINTTAISNPVPITHTVKIDGQVVYEKAHFLEAGHEEGLVLDVPEVPLTAGVHTIEYYNSDPLPWEACVVLYQRKPDGTWIAVARIIAYGTASSNKILTAQTMISDAFITVDVTGTPARADPGDLLKGNVTLTNYGTASGACRLIVRFLGTDKRYTFPWVTLNPGASATFDLSATGLTVPRWTEIDYQAIDALPKNKYGPWALYILEVQDQTLFTIASYLLQIDYNLITDASIIKAPLEDKVKAPITVHITASLAWANYKTLESGHIAGAPVELYMNEFLFKTLTTNEKGNAYEDINIAVAGAYTFHVIFKGNENFPPDTSTFVYYYAEPTTGVFAKIESVTLPCNQTLNPGTYITGDITVRNVGDASGYLMCRVTVIDSEGKIVKVIYSYTTSQIPPGEARTFTITQAEGIVLGNLSYDIFIEAGYTDPASPTASFVPTDVVLCHVTSTAEKPVGHIESITLPSSLYAGEKITGSVTVKNAGNVRGKIALKITTLWDNRLAFADYMELDPGISWTIDIGDLNILMPATDATLRFEVGHLTDTSMETFVLDEPPIEKTITLTAPPPPGTAIIYGYVTDSFTGKPVPNATVTLNGYSATTDSRGWYSITAPVGTYTFIVSALDYESHMQTVNLSASTQKDVQLKPTTAVVHGYVRDLTGYALAGATVKLNEIYTATTDSRGYYMIEKVRVGRTYTITASKTGYETYSGTINIPTADIYRYDINLKKTAPPPPKYAQIQGVVRSPLGTVANATLCLNGICTGSNPDGTYTITGIPLGTYTLQATPPFPQSLILKGVTQTLEISEAKTYTLDIYLPLNIINITGVTAGLAAFIGLAVKAARE